jgi:hypothetical protein
VLLEVPLHSLIATAFSYYGFDVCQCWWDSLSNPTLFYKKTNLVNLDESITPVFFFKKYIYNTW